MKTTFDSAVILGAAVALVGVAAAPCNTTALSQFTTTENVSTCRADTGYSLTSMAMPNDAQITALCNSEACQESINAVKQVAPDECTIGSIRLYADVINPLSQRCGMSSGSDIAAGSASAPGSGPMADDVGAGSIAGNATSPASASMAGSAMDQPVTTTPQPNTRPTTRSPAPTPTPSPSPGAGNGGADAPTLSMCAAIAVLAAVVAAIL